MIATHTQQAAQKNSFSLNLSHEDEFDQLEAGTSLAAISNPSAPSALLLPGRIVTHCAKAGLNPLVDAASYLFTILGKLKQMQAYRQLGKLQKKLVREITLFQETINPHYSAEYLVVCRYILCATFDDIISGTNWGGHGQWHHYSLLTEFNQDPHHHDKFFTILERAIKEPTMYIDLMEFIYICLSMGYKGQYRVTEHSQFQLEQIMDNLYKHIRLFRGSFSRALSPVPLKSPKLMAKVASAPKKPVGLTVAYTTACVVMAIFISLSYLMDVISNDVYKDIAQIKKPVSYETQL